MNYALAILVQCQNVLAMIGVELAISANIFLQFLRNTQPWSWKDLSKLCPSRHLPVQSYAIGVVLVSLLLPLNIFHTLS